ncbi:NAD(P)-binding protein [Nocardioides sp. YIM 152588]|uniref:NAD(P)-binding protein n=1 Tax=Nocardioides sp. YIM 152588 TaxID=3158259 RepID=UPI0032E4E7F7
MRRVETDYLVVGAGMAGMGFVDELLEVSDADVLMIDRRHAPGGHWNDAYPFVRLHQPSGWYGVGSAVLGEDRIATDGPEAGHYTRVSGVEIQAYFAERMRDRFLPSGRVRFLPKTDYLGGTPDERGGVHRIRSLFGGEETEVVVRKRLVDATWTSSRVPQTFPPPFEVADGVRVVTPTELTRLGFGGEDTGDGPVDGVTIVGTGKTAFDTGVWLLEQGCPPESITWIRTRDAWLNNVHFMQPGKLSDLTVEGTVAFLEALAAHDTLDEVLAEVERREVILRIDPDVEPTIFRGPTISTYEVDQLRRIDDVVRLGRVLRIEPDRIVLERGEVPTTPGQVHVHCAAPGLPERPPVPIFADGRITVQYLTRASMPLSSGAIARTEALDLTDEERNALCPANFMDQTPLGYLQMLLRGLATEGTWRGHPGLKDWFATTRVNATRSRPDEDRDPARQALYGRLLEAIEPAYATLERLTPAP